MVSELNSPAQPSRESIPVPGSTSAETKPVPAPANSESATDSKHPDSDSKDNQRKRRFDSDNRNRGRGRDRERGGGRGRGKDWGRGKKGKEIGRDKYNREYVDRRERNQQTQDQKRRKVNENGDAVAADEPSSSYMSIQFPDAEIAAEERRPKRKVAVMVGYAGTGYHGLQINHKDKTIEGDIFAAFVAAKAISKANADDPRKSSLVRCARTDKGVHAAGNMLSLKLIIEDSDVVKKINDALPPQIRVWGIQRTNNPFSCYQACDSRWYEYLMPSYCLLPPHPESYIGKRVLESVKEKNVEDEYAKRLNEVKDYWEEVEKNDIQPILDSLDVETRESVIRRMHAADPPPGEKDAAQKEAPKSDAEDAKPTDESKTTESESVVIKMEDELAVEAASKDNATEDTSTIAAELASAPPTKDEPNPNNEPETIKPKELHPVERALKKIKAAYIAAKRRYRATPERIAHLQEVLDHYVGTRNFHNYTIQKPYNDPSARRTIKSFVVNPNPVQINDTQWLSLKVHGQSFMMHQIRKMVGMAVLVTRCATPLSILDASYTDARISIPKAPGLGLLLERPVFENWNKRAVENYNLEELDFGKFEKEIQEFKDTMIYRHIFAVEEKENSFHTFFHQIDNFKSDYFMWVTAAGLEAAHKRVGPSDPVPDELKAELGEDGDEDAEAGEG